MNHNISTTQLMAYQTQIEQHARQDINASYRRKPCESWLVFSDAQGTRTAPVLLMKIRHYFRKKNEGYCRVIPMPYSYVRQSAIVSRFQTGFHFQASKTEEKRGVFFWGGGGLDPCMVEKATLTWS